MSALVELPVAFGPGQYVRPEAVTCIRSRMTRSLYWSARATLPPAPAAKARP